MLSLRTWYTLLRLRIPEPRAVNLIIGIGYASFTLGGVATLIYPPRTIVAAGGDIVMSLVGLLLLFGGLVGMFAGTAEFWQFERLGIVAMGLGVLTYIYIVLMLHLTESGSRLTQLSLVTVALIFLVLRFAMIWKYDFKPRR